MATDEVDGAAADEVVDGGGVGDRVRVALGRGDGAAGGVRALGGRRSQALLARAALEGGERIGAGVEDVDVVSREGEGHGETPGAAAEVEDDEGAAQLTLASGRQGVHGLPDRGGPDVGGGGMADGSAAQGHGSHCSRRHRRRRGAATHRPELPGEVCHTFREPPADEVGQLARAGPAGPTSAYGD